MTNMNRTLIATAAMLALTALLAGCAPEVGSERWCEKMGEKPKGDWTANEATDFAKFCVLNLKPE